MYASMRDYYVITDHEKDYSNTTIRAETADKAIEIAKKQTMHSGETSIRVYHIDGDQPIATWDGNVYKYV